ncbi:nucleoside-diphosphate kinase [Candidatus Kaiserbacteria bacterium]|nr:nucleoside-diphosphate kinase [Candidatus Kaiserbacteria bacterium]MCB9811389.1 nucleoside-diphosphate kinase [Candidatus Nomurabacteria bacterium]
MSRLPHQEQSLVLLKPDTVQRSLVGELIKRFEQTGLKIVAMKMVYATEEQLLAHYNKDDEWYQRKGEGIVKDMEAHTIPVEKEAIEYGKDIVRNLVKYMMAAPLVAMVMEGNQAVAVVSKIVGTTEPSTSDVGTIRGDYTVDSYAHATLENRGVRNLVHQSESVDEAQREIPLWFTPAEVLKYVTAQERIMYDVNFDGTKD